MYRTVDSAFWTDPKVRKLNTAEKLVFLYLFTNPFSHVSGIFIAPFSTIAAQVGISEKQLNSALDTLSRAEFVVIDPPISAIWVVNMFKFQGHGAKNARAAAKRLEEDLHNSFIVKAFLESYPEVAKHYSPRKKPTLDTLSNTISGFGAPDSRLLTPDSRLPTPELNPPTPEGALADLPVELDNDAFRLAWEQWQQHRREKRQTLTPTSTCNQLSKLAAMGSDRAIAAVNHSIAQGWTGIFEPKEGNRDPRRSSKTSGDQQSLRYDPARDDEP